MSHRPAEMSSIALLTTTTFVVKPEFPDGTEAITEVHRHAGRRLRLSPPAWFWRITPYAIGALASFWLIERVAVF